MAPERNTVLPKDVLDEVSLDLFRKATDMFLENRNFKDDLARAFKSGTFDGRGLRFKSQGESYFLRYLHTQDVYSYLTLTREKQDENEGIFLEISYFPKKSVNDNPEVESSTFRYLRLVDSKEIESYENSQIAHEKVRKFLNHI